MDFSAVWSMVGLVIIWIMPGALVFDLENRRGHQLGCMGALTIFIPILALIFIPIQLFQKPNIEGVQKKLQQSRSSPIFRAIKGISKNAEVSSEEIEKAASLKPWLWRLALGIILII